MSAVTSETTLRASFNWALWRVLDHLAARFMPGSLLDRTARGQAAAPGSANAPDLPGVFDSALAALRGVDPAELEAALASLSDDNSPLVQSLAWALGTPQLDAVERQRRLEASLAVLSRAEAFALLAVLLMQAQSA